MGAYLRGRVYHYKRMIDGRTYYRSLKIHKGQELLLSGRIKQVDDEITALHFGLPVPGPGIKLSEYVKAYLKHKAHKKSIDRDRQRLEYIADVWPDLPLGQYRRSHMDDLERSLKNDGLKPATVNRYMELVRHLFNLAIEDGFLIKNPLAHYEPYVEDATRRALSDDEIRAVFAAVDKIKNDKRFKSIRSVAHDLILFALVTGMRLSEILFLRRDQVHENTIILPISATKSRRRGPPSKQRIKLIALSDIALEVISRQPEAEDGYVFRLQHRHPNTVFYLAKKIRELSGIREFSFHSLRHTASTIVSSQTSLATARAVLGHADIKTTLRYTHPELADQRASVEKLGARIKGIIG
jgi:integrase